MSYTLFLNDDTLNPAHYIFAANALSYVTYFLIRSEMELADARLQIARKRFDLQIWRKARIRKTTNEIV